jgi:excisionase family DNA binding protein
MQTSTPHLADATLLTKREAAERLSLGPRMVDIYIARGELPVVRFGRAVRIDRRDLAAFIEAHRDGGHDKERAAETDPQRAHDEAGAASADPEKFDDRTTELQRQI